MYYGLGSWSSSCHTSKVSGRGVPGVPGVPGPDRREDDRNAADVIQLAEGNGVSIQRKDGSA